MMCGMTKLQVPSASVLMILLLIIMLSLPSPSDLLIHGYTNTATTTFRSSMTVKTNIVDNQHMIQTKYHTSDNNIHSITTLSSKNLKTQMEDSNDETMKRTFGTRRHFVDATIRTGAVAAMLALTTNTESSYAASTQVLTTPKGVKYAIIKPAVEQRTPFDKDLVAVEYTGYLLDGSIFDSTHAEGKKNALTFQVGSAVVIEGINEMVKNMGVGEKVQAIIPPDLAFGDKGICLESGECLVKPKSTLVYDIYLKRSAIPPP